MRTPNSNRIARWLRAIRDPDVHVRMCIAGWEETKNPAYLWQVIAICAEHEKPVPSVVTTYLADVAQRMLSDPARASSDLRNVLPRIMGFPDKGRGPGRLLDPDADDPHKIDLAIMLAVELESTDDLDEALTNATRELPPEFADVGLDTLKRWVTKAVGLERMPRDAAEWRSSLRERFGALLAVLEE